jgi:hypothetical protein
VTLLGELLDELYHLYGYCSTLRLPPFSAMRQVEREIEGKEWTTRMVTELAKTLMDLKETLFGTQNKAAEIEIGSALHKHVVSSVQNAEVPKLPKISLG